MNDGYTRLDGMSICGIAKFALCRVVTRYRNFVSEFYIIIDEGDGMGITFDQADEMLKKIDEHIGTSLQLTPHQ